MNGVVAPMIAELWTQGRTRALETMLRGATTLATIPSVLGFVVVAVAGGPIMRIAYGPHFARGGHILAILAFGVAFGVAAGSCNFALIMTGPPSGGRGRLGHHARRRHRRRDHRCACRGHDRDRDRVVGQHRVPERAAHRDGEEADRHLDPRDPVAPQGPRRSSRYAADALASCGGERPEVFVGYELREPLVRARDSAPPAPRASPPGSGGGGGEPPRHRDDRSAPPRSPRSTTGTG